MPINLDTLTFDLDDNPWDDLPAHVKTDVKRIAIMVFACVLAVEALFVLVLFFIFPSQRPERKPGQSVKTMIVLGSGGHTAEMLRLVNALDKNLYSPRVYITADTDALSGRKAMEAEKTYQPDGKAKECDLYAIPRSREVGQSYFTSVFTTLRAMLVAAVAVWQLKPEVILVNGPGTCIPVCVAALVYRKLHIKHCDIIYVESIARVQTLSLSGLIMYHLRIADMVLVQWPKLREKYPRTQFVDRLY